MKPPAASPGRAEKPQLAAPAPPGLARLLLSKSRRGGRSRRAPATSPMFVSRGRSRAAGAADGEPSSPKVTCIGQVRMRKGKKKAAGVAVPPKKAGTGKAKGYCRCLKKAFLCGGLFAFDRRRRPSKAPAPAPPEAMVERASRRSPWVFSSRDVAVAAAPKPVDDARSGRGEEDGDEVEVFFGSVGRDQDEAAEDPVLPGRISRGGKKEDEEPEEPQLVSSATTTPPKNALLLMRCRSAPQNRTSPLTSRFPVASALLSISPESTSSPSTRKPDLSLSPVPSPSPPRRKGNTIRFSPAPSPSPRRKPPENVKDEDDREEQRRGTSFASQLPDQAKEEDATTVRDDEEEAVDDDDDDDYDDDEMRCSSARPLVLPRCKSEPATTAAAKMAGADATTTAGCFWANGGSSGRRRPPPARPVVVALTGH